MKGSFVDLPFLCILLSLLFQTASLGLGKQAALTIETFSLQSVFTNPYYILSIACLGFQAVVWQVALRKYPLSFAYFFMSGIFVNIMIMSYFIFREEVSTGNLVGSALIIFGIILLTRTERPADYV